MADLTIAPHNPDPKKCAWMFEPGELVDVSGDRFAPHAKVTLTLQGKPLVALKQVATTDDAGHLALTIGLPSSYKGVAFPGADLPVGYIEAEGPGADSTEEIDNAMFTIGSADRNCGQTPTPDAGVTIGLMGDAFESAPTTGAVFAVTGPGLPKLVAGNPPLGSFAGLDIGDDGGAECTAAEPAGVHCANGVVGDLQAGSTYTVTELTPPPDYAAAAPQTFVAKAGTDDDLVPLYFDNHYVGPPLTSRLGVSYFGVGGNGAGAVFAVTGPGLPVVRDAAPIAGAFAEIDFTEYGEPVCPPKEPTGVHCEDGLITDLQPNSTYTVSQVAAPSGHSLAAPQKVTTDALGGTVVAYFDNARG